MSRQYNLPGAGYYNSGASGHSYNIPGAYVNEEASSGALTVTVSDDLNNWADALAKLFSYLMSPSETLNNWADSLASIESYELLNGESLNNWADSFTAIYSYLLSTSDTLSLSDTDNLQYSYLLNIGDSFTLSDSLVIDFSSPFVERAISDDLNNWADSATLRLAYLLTTSDNLDNWLDDVAAVLGVQVTTDLPVYAYDSMMYSWADAIAMKASVELAFADTLTISDFLNKHSDIFLRVSDQIVMSDGGSQSFKEVYLNVSDDLNNWLDRTYPIQNAELTRSVADSLNYWDDSSDPYRSTAFTSYIRRYLNDVR